MVKHTETIRRLLLTNRLSVSEHFMRLVFKGFIPAKSFGQILLKMLYLSKVLTGVNHQQHFMLSKRLFLDGVIARKLSSRGFYICMLTLAKIGGH